MTGQTKRGSFAEACLNVAIGYGVALASQLAHLPALRCAPDLGTNALIGVWFTVISIVRSYVLRRWFNRRTVRA
jgi:hypothetical protein